MTVRRLIAIGFIFLGTTAAWFTLGLAVVQRSSASGSAMSHDVVELWGGHHAQPAPQATYCRPLDWSGPFREIPISRTRADVALQLDHRRKGLLWHDTYAIDFAAVYTYRIPEEARCAVRFTYQFPSAQAIYDGFVLRIDGKQIEHVGDLAQGVTTTMDLEPGSEVVVELAYRSRGLDVWRYLFAGEGIATVRDFELALTTDFERIDFPTNALSPSVRTRTTNGWLLEWNFDSLVSGRSIGMDLPNRLNPGPLTARITFFAPVSLLFFFTLLVILDVLGHLRLHPAHYFFLSTAFFAFHLLIAYLVDHVDIHFAFVSASIVSIGLVVSYLRLVCGIEKALRYAGATQLVYLVLFSYAFFFEGYTGLTVTIAAVLTLFLIMQLTGRVDWEKALRAPAPKEPVPDPF